VEAKPGGLPDDHDVIACMTAGGRPGEVKVYVNGPQVVVLAPAGEAALFTATAARAFSNAVMRRAGIAEAYVKSRGQRLWPTASSEEPSF
jgi:hypothetical protein